MKFKDVFLMCLDSLKKQKVRTLLTVIGVVIGTCAIVVMISLGIGMQKSTEEALSQMGDLTLIQIYNWSGNTALDPLDDAMLEKIRKQDHVLGVMPIYSLYSYQYGELSIKSGKYSYEGEIYGVKMEDLEIFGYTTTEGRLPNAEDDEKTIVMGSQAAYNFYDAKRNKYRREYMGEEPFVAPMEDDITIVVNRTDNNTSSKRQPSYDLKNVGILAEDYNKNPYPVYAAFIDIDFIQELQAEYKKYNKIKEDRDKVDTGYQQVVIKVDDMKNVAEVEEFIKTFGYDTNSMESIRKPLEEQTRSQQMMLGGLAAISLLVAAIGIANTMIMSIYERTREIGIMKVLGCPIGDIRRQFLLEAGTIGFLGGVVGVGLSYGISFVINSVSAGGGGDDMGFGMLLGGIGLGGTSIIPPWLALVGMVFATLVGLVSGFSPANRAVKISALTAMKQE